MNGLEERLARGIACKIEGRYEEAAAEIKAVLAESPLYAEAHHQLGLVYGFVGLFDESIAELEQSVRLDPSLALARNDLALTYTMLGRYDEAKAEFALVLEKDRHNDVALRNLTYLP
jgi:tetratricopeptide (TPR) repeat protein